MLKTTTDFVESSSVMNAISCIHIILWPIVFIMIFFQPLVNKDGTPAGKLPSLYLYV